MPRPSLRILTTCFLASWFLIPAIHAACTNPAGDTGHVIFNSTQKAMQYCNGTNWMNTGLANASATQTGCTSPAGQAGMVIYNSATAVVQFCNGQDWINTACPTSTTPGGSGCSGSRPGTLRYASTANQLQFCDSTNWITVGYGCPLPTSVTQVFSADPYVGNNTNKLVTNGINLAGYGGFVWTKNRTNTFGSTGSWTSTSNFIWNFVSDKYHKTDTNEALEPLSSQFQPRSNGFFINSSHPGWNADTTYMSWTFREAPKFMDIVTWVGDGTNGRIINHSLDSMPGMMLVKKGGNLLVLHSGYWFNSIYGYTGAYMNIMDVNGNRSTDNFGNTNAYDTGIRPTSDTLTLDTRAPKFNPNISGTTYVAYLFGNDTSSTGFIRCGSVITNGTMSDTVITGWPVQFVMTRYADSSGNWMLVDTKRTPSWTGDEAYINADGDGAETTTNLIDNRADGFTLRGFSFTGKTLLYCAIRAAN